jgi:pyruvate dehydrogenase E1 component alpha subunit
MFDAELYRDRSEVDLWRQRDPIATMTSRLRDTGGVTDESLTALEASIADEIEAAVRFAEAGTWEPVSDLLKDVYTPVEHPAAVR